MKKIISVILSIIIISALVPVKTKAEEPALTLQGSDLIFVYDGTAHEAAAQILSGGNAVSGTVEYSTSADNVNWSEYSQTVPSLKNAGSLYVKARGTYGGAVAETDYMLVAVKRQVNVVSGNKIAKAENALSVATNPEITVYGDGFVAGEVTVTATGSQAAPATEGYNVKGENTIEYQWAEGADASNYEITESKGTLALFCADGVNPDVMLSNYNGTYDGLYHAVQMSYILGISGRPVTITFDPGPAGTIVHMPDAPSQETHSESGIINAYYSLKDATVNNSGELKTLTPSVQIVDEDGNKNKDSFTMTVYQRIITILPKSGQSKTYGQSDQAIDYIYAGEVDGETLTFEGALSREPGETAGTYNYTLGTLTETSGNYKLVLAEQTPTFEIEKACPEVTGTTAYSKSYDGTADAAAVLGTVTGISEGDDVTVEIDSAAFSDKNAGADKEVTVKYKLSGSDCGNYVTPEDDIISATISPKLIRVTAEDKTSYVGSELAELTYTADDLVAGDSFTGALATDADKDAAGEYDITLGTLTVNNGNGGNNYAIDYTKGTYRVTAKEIQTLAFAGITDGKLTKTYGDAGFTETAAGAETGITYSSSNPDVAAVDSSTGAVTVLKAGTAVITAAAAEDAEHASASVSYTLTVNKKQLTVSGTTAADKVYDGTTAADVTMGILNGVVDGDKVTVTAAGTFVSAEVGENDVSVVYTISGKDADNYIKPADEIIKATISEKPAVNTGDNSHTLLYILIAAAALAACAAAVILLKKFKK